MSLLHLESWDHFSTADLLEKGYTIVDGTSSGTPPSLAIGAYGRNSTNGLRSVSGVATGNALGKCPALAVGSLDSRCLVGFAFRQANRAFSDLSVGTIGDTVSGANGCNALVVIRRSGTTQGYLRINTDGSISYYRGSTGTLVATSSHRLTVGTYVYLELDVLLDNLAGSVDLYVNNEHWIAVSGVTTAGSSPYTWNQVYLNKVMSTQTVQWDIDDLYIASGSGSDAWTTRRGDMKIVVIQPTAAGATTEWTPSAGANWENVADEIPDDDGTYNEVLPADNTDTFVCGDVDVAASVLGVQVSVLAKLESAGSASVAPVIRISGTDHNGTAQALTTAYAYVKQAYGVQPTSTAWSPGAVNGAEFGYYKHS